jgi:hypothetical protein
LKISLIADSAAIRLNVTVLAQFGNFLDEIRFATASQEFENEKLYQYNKVRIFCIEPI